MITSLLITCITLSQNSPFMERVSTNFSLSLCWLML